MVDDLAYEVPKYPFSNRMLRIRIIHYLAQSKLWDEGTLCITIAANIAETAILKYPMCFPDSVVGFSAFPEESSEKFMHYVFTYIRNSIQDSVAGSIQDNINIDYLSQLDFKVPPKNYQDKVVES